MRDLDKVSCCQRIEKLVEICRLMSFGSSHRQEWTCALDMKDIRGESYYLDISSYTNIYQCFTWFFWYLFSVMHFKSVIPPTVYGFHTYSFRHLTLVRAFHWLFWDYFNKWKLGTQPVSAGISLFMMSTEDMVPIILAHWDLSLWRYFEIFYCLQPDL